MSKRKLRGFDFERLEDRRLLAADFGAEVFQCCNMLPAETCMATTMEVEDGIMGSDFEEPDVVETEPAGNTEIEGAVAPGQSIEEPNCQTEEDSVVNDVATDEPAPVAVDVEAIELQEPELDVVECETELEVGDGVEVEVEVGVEVGVGVEDGVEVEVGVEVGVGEGDLVASKLRDPVTGTSGYFGEIDEITPTKSMTFTPSESGTVDAVIASSFGESETRMEITDANGELVTSSMMEELNGFQRLTFEVVENETYEITVSSDETGEGYFMVTVDFKATGESLPVDLHADEIGESATLLEVRDGTVTIETELETAEDCDAFRFVAPADGEILLGMAASSEDHQSNAIVSVCNAEGDLVVAGSTNEEVAIRFDAQSGVEYQVLVDSQNDVPTKFSLNGTLFANVVEEAEPVDEPLPLVDTVLDGEAKMEVEDGLDVCDSDSETSENALVDEVFEQLGDDPMAENDSARNRFGGHHHRPWFRRM